MLGHKDVCRLNVTVNDSLAVGGSESVRHLNSPFEHLFQRQGLAGDAVLQRGAFHEFHGDKRLTVLLADLVDGADVGMVQRGGRARLSAKTLQSLRVLRHVIGKKFQRDKTTKRVILGFIDNPHAAATQLFDDSVVRDGLADRDVGNGCAAVIQEIVEIGEWSFS